MTDDRSLERVARSWLEAGPTQAPERAVDAALLRIESTSQERALRIPWRFPNMTLPARLAVLAVVGALLLAGLALLGGGGGRPHASDGPTSQAFAPESSAASSSSVSPSPSPTVVPIRALPESGPLTPGRYSMRMPDASVDAEFTVGSGWTSGGWYVNNETSSMSFWKVSNVYRDACDIGLGSAAIGPRVDDLVTALDDQVNTDMSAPIDVVVDRHPGVRVELSPSGSLPEVCQDPMWLWTRPNGEVGRGIDRLGGPGELVEPVWILDVDGERVVIVAYNSGHSQAAGDPTVPVIESMTLTKG